MVRIRKAGKSSRFVWMLFRLCWYIIIINHHGTLRTKEKKSTTQLRTVTAGWSFSLAPACVALGAICIKGFLSCKSKSLSSASDLLAKIESR